MGLSFIHEKEDKSDPLKVQSKLPIYMLLFGYATITSFNEKSQMVEIKFPNEEIESEIQSRLEEYVPSKKKFISYCREHLKMLFRDMNDGNIRTAMNLLREYEFVPISHHSSADGVTAGELQRRVRKLFYDAGITYREGVKFPKDNQTSKDGGDIDLLTMIRDLFVHLVQIQKTAFLTNCNFLGAIRIHHPKLPSGRNSPQNYYDLSQNSDTNQLLVLDFPV